MWNFSLLECTIVIDFNLIIVILCWRDVCDADSKETVPEQQRDENESRISSMYDELTNGVTNQQTAENLLPLLKQDNKRLVFLAVI
jgi:hypothetical protein